MNYFIVDALNLAFRAHNVFYESTTSDGRPSGMIYGFFAILQSLKKKYRGYKFIVVWDSKPVWKYEINHFYKSGRSGLSSSVKEQIPDIKEFLKFCNVDQYEKHGQEADDVIATLVEKFKKEKECGTILVYSNDKDLLQLVETGKVIVFKPKVGKNSPEKFYDRDSVIEKFGVPPEKLVNFRCLDGDSSDTIKGVSRVRRKKLATCINDSQDLGQAFELFKTSDMSENERKKLAAFKETAFKNHSIMILNKNLRDLEYIKATVRVDTLVELIDKYEIKKLNPRAMAELFQSSLNVRYSEARPTYRIESVSLFDN